MKKNVLITSALVLTLTALFINGCKKDDTTSPVVTLSGSSSVTVSLNSSAYSDAGASATDNEDGTITPVMSGSVNVNLVGTYTITWTATDAAGNSGTATRTVTVKNDAAYLNGTYTCSEDNFATNWTQQIYADSTHNNRIVFQYFGDYVTTPMVPKIYGQVTGSAVELATPQNAAGGNSGCTHTFSGNGTATIPIALVSGKYNFSIKFTDQQLSGGSGCTATGAVPTEDVCHQN